MNSKHTISFAKVGCEVHPLPEPMLIPVAYSKGSWRKGRLCQRHTLVDIECVSFWDSDPDENLGAGLVCFFSYNPDYVLPHNYELFPTRPATHVSVVVGPPKPKPGRRPANPPPVVLVFDGCSIEEGIAS